MDRLNKSPAIETIYARILRQQLQQLCICSPKNCSGNTTITLNIARRAAESGKRVLLIELNRSTPVLASQLNLKQQEWLPLTGHWEHAAQDTDQAGLMLLCCPLKSSNCVEFRDQETLKLFFDRCRQQFDMVICDTDPLLNTDSKASHSPSDYPERLAVDIICAASQATLLNVVTGKTTESQIDECREILFQSGARLSGVIMNDRHAPGLKQELIRETYRLERFLPSLMAGLRKRLDKMVLLNQEL